MFLNCLCNKILLLLLFCLTFFAWKNPAFSQNQTANTQNIANSQSSPTIAAETNWPLYEAYWKIVVLKDGGFEPGDERWVHLHNHNHRVPDSFDVVLRVEIYGQNKYETMDLENSNIELRYVVRGVVISDWLSAPFRFPLSINNPNLVNVPDGISEVSVQIRGSNRSQFQPVPGFVHISNGREVDSSVPIITGDEEDSVISSYGPGATYVSPDDRNFRSYPAKSNVTAWHNAPYEEDLYLELMAPHTPLFVPAEMWWDHLAHPGMPYIRGLPPKHDEDHRFLRSNHERFPFKDGGRGVAWMSPYVTGQINSSGVFYFAEIGGRIGWLKPDGSVTTLAGWRVIPGKDPIWYKKPLEKVRLNMELRGTWLNGQYPGESGGFRTPLDVAIDPNNDKILYVVGYEDNCIWKVEVLDENGDRVNVSVFAGDPNHQAGFTNGQGFAARFNGPASLVWDPVSDALYVADQDNDAIRKITRSGEVSTLFGSPGMAQRLRSQGVSDVYDQLENRAASKFEVNASLAAQGNKPDIYLPQTIRVDSLGNIILLELGYGAVRKINPLSGETKKLGEVQQKFGEYDRGWAWLDVDRWGNSGPRNGIYWCKFVGEEVDGDSFNHYNEVYAWLPPEGGMSKMVFGESTNSELWPDGWGPINATNPSHYPWLVAVDPRGALLISGGGEHGLSRLRKRRSDDPVPGEFEEQYQRYDQAGAYIWRSGLPQGINLSATAPALKFGWEAHNYLGFADAWGLRGASDEAILTAFEIKDNIKNNASNKADLLYFLKRNVGSGEATVDPSPTPQPSPTPVPGAPVVNAGSDQTILLSKSKSISLQLRGSISDDGLPRKLSTRWVRISGPKVTISSPKKTSSKIRLSKFGTYRIQLSANDGLNTVTDELTITVQKKEKVKKSKTKKK